VKDNFLSLVGIVETRVRSVNKDFVSNSIFNGWSVIDNYHHHDGGRIWVAWDPCVFNLVK